MIIFQQGSKVEFDRLMRVIILAETILTCFKAIEIFA